MTSDTDALTPSAIAYTHIDILARTLWGEARGEGRAGMEAVASVILNRVAIAKQAGGYWWGTTIFQVCQKPYQFSCWNTDDPNYAKIRSLTNADLFFVIAQRVARRAVFGTLPDSTGGATHYHVAGLNPKWAQRQTPTARIGRHVFYRLP